MILRLCRARVTLRGQRSLATVTLCQDETSSEWVNEVISFQRTSLSVGEDREGLEIEIRTCSD